MALPDEESGIDMHELARAQPETLDDMIWWAEPARFEQSKPDDGLARVVGCSWAFCVILLGVVVQVIEVSLLLAAPAVVAHDLDPGPLLPLAYVVFSFVFYGRNGCRDFNDIDKLGVETCHCSLTDNNLRELKDLVTRMTRESGSEKAWGCTSRPVLRTKYIHLMKPSAARFVVIVTAALSTGAIICASKISGGGRTATFARAIVVTEAIKIVILLGHLYVLRSQEARLQCILESLSATGCDAVGRVLRDKPYTLRSRYPRDAFGTGVTHIVQLYKDDVIVMYRELEFPPEPSPNGKFSM